MKAGAGVVKEGYHEPGELPVICGEIDELEHLLGCLGGGFGHCSLSFFLRLGRAVPGRPAVRWGFFFLGLRVGSSWLSEESYRCDPFLIAGVGVDLG